MNYLMRFGIEYNPFIKNTNKDICINLSDYDQLIFRLRRLEQNKGIGVITGEPGLGKTTSIRHWARSLNTNLFKVIYISHSTLTMHEFCRELCDDLGIDVNHSKRVNLKAVQAEIKRLSIEKRITPVIILDEANYLPPQVLNDLKIIFNFDMDSREPYILLLIGQNSLRKTLNMKAHEALAQRVSMTYELKGLSKDESKKYIDEKLKQAGLNADFITPEGYNQVIAAAKGTPRVINQIMDKALLLVENRKESRIDEVIAMSAIDESTI